MILLEVRMIHSVGQAVCLLVMALAILAIVMILMGAKK